MITEKQFLEAQQLINEYIEQLKQANVIKSLPTDNEKFRRWKIKNFYEDAGGFTEYKTMKKRPPETTLQNLYDEWLLTD